MDERSAGRRKLEVLKGGERTSSGVVPAAGAPEILMGITTGVVLDEKYRVGEIVGTGAVGIVFEAQNLELDEKVAIKCLRAELLIDDAVVGRFAREAKAAAAIKSEYVATVYDVGTSRDGVPYMVMEYLEGKSLGKLVEEVGTLPPRTAVEYVLQICEALAVAHAKGIVHRDIKPENLLLTERAGLRIVKVLDFGISKAALTGSIFRDELPLVQTVNLMGTPLYMSPEQVRRSNSVDVRSDVWSVGMVLYEILTGETAFDGASITEICAAILETEPKPIELRRNDLPSGLVEVIGRTLEKDVTRRYQNIGELALDLMPFGPKRSRLNVERAVAALQGAGHIDPAFRVDSTAPPPFADLVDSTPMPVSAPQIVGLESAPVAPAASTESLQGLASTRISTTPSRPSRHSSEKLPIAGRPTARTGFALVAFVVVGLSAIAIVTTILQRRAAPAASPGPTTEPVSAPTVVTTPVVKTAATPAVSAEPSAKPAFARPGSAAGSPAPTAPRAWPVSKGAGARQDKKAPAAPSASTPPPAKPEAPSEPDLGY